MLSLDIGSAVWVAKAINPQAAAAGAINGTSMDRMTAGEQGFRSCVCKLSVGATTGTPTSFTVDAKLQDSADGTTFADVSPAQNLTQLTTANSETRLGVNLLNLRRYVRMVVTPAFVGGTSPTVAVAAEFVFGGARKIPVLSLTT